MLNVALLFSICTCVAVYGRRVQQIFREEYNSNHKTKTGRHVFDVHTPSSQRESPSHHSSVNTLATFLLGFRSLASFQSPRQTAARTKAFAVSVRTAEPYATKAFNIAENQPLDSSPVRGLVEPMPIGLFEEKPQITQVLDDLKDDFIQLMHSDPHWFYFADDFAIVDRKGSKIREGDGLGAVKLLLEQVRHARSKFMRRDRIRFKVQGVDTRDGWCDAQWNIRLDGVTYPHWNIDRNATVNLLAMTRFHINEMGKIDRMQFDSLSLNRKEYKLLLNQMLERDLADDVEDDAPDTSFMSVAKWPPLKLFTFGECAFSFNRTEDPVQLPGFRVVFDDDPVPTVVGQSVGFDHDAMVPLVNFSIPIENFSIPIDDAIDEEHDDQDVEDTDDDEDQHDDIEEDLEADGRVAVLDKFLSFFKDKDLDTDEDEETGADDEDSTYEDFQGETTQSGRVMPILGRAYSKMDDYRKSVLRPSNRSLVGLRWILNGSAGERKSTTVLRKLLARANEQVVRQARKFPGPALQKIFAPEVKKRHSMQNYVALTRRRLLEQRAGTVNENLQIYRMALVTQRISALDANDVESVSAAVESLNREVNPRRPRRRLFNSLEPVMNLQFFTPSRAFFRALNNRFGYEKIGNRGIAHNVHLLKDKRNNGYLSFEGTSNLATWFDVHFAFQRYDPDAQQTPLADIVDDDRWEIIEPGYLYNCHTGFSGSLKALVSNEQFPLLAERIAGLRSLTVVGHSFGGSLASMLVMSADAVKELEKREFNLWRHIPILRRFWSKDAANTEKDQPSTRPAILNYSDQDAIIEELSLEQKATLRAALSLEMQLSDDDLKSSDWDIRMIELVDKRALEALTDYFRLSNAGSKARLFLRLKNYMLSSLSRSILAQKRQLRSTLRLDDDLSNEELASAGWEIKIASAVNRQHLEKVCKERGLPQSASNALMFLNLKIDMLGDFEELSLEHRMLLRSNLKLDDKVLDNDLAKPDWEIKIISMATPAVLKKSCAEYGLSTSGSKADLFLLLKRFALEAVQKRNFELKKEFRRDLEMCEKISDVDLAGVNWDINIIDMCRVRDLQRLCKEQYLEARGSKSELFLRLKDFMYQVGRFAAF